MNTKIKTLLSAILVVATLGGLNGIPGGTVITRTHSTYELSPYQRVSMLAPPLMMRYLGGGQSMLVSTPQGMQQYVIHIKNNLYQIAHYLKNQGSNDLNNAANDLENMAGSLELYMGGYINAYH